MAKKSFKKLLISGLLSVAVAIAPAAMVSAAAAPTVSITWDPANLTITNNVSLPDTVELINMVDGQILKVYDKDPASNSTSSKAKLFGQATAKNGKATVNLGNNLKDDGTSTVFIAVVAESAASSYSGGSPKTTADIDPANVTVVNKAGINDTVTVTHLTYAGTKVSIFNGTTEIKGTSVLGQDPAFPTDKTKKVVKDVVVSIKQLAGTGNKIQVQLTEPGKKPSGKVDVSYSAEAKSDVTSVTYGTHNNYNKNDVIEVYGLAVGDAVKVYTSSGKTTQIGATVKAVKVVSRGNAIIASLSTKDFNASLNGATGSVWFTATKVGYTESDAQQADFAAEPVSTTPSVTGVTYKNTKNTGDKITITGNPQIIKGDKITVYETSSTATSIGTGIASADGTATITVSNKLQAAGGKYAITISTPFKRESAKSTDLDYGNQS